MQIYVEFQSDIDRKDGQVAVDSEGTASGNIYHSLEASRCLGFWGNFVGNVERWSCSIRGAEKYCGKNFQIKQH